MLIDTKTAARRKLRFNSIDDLRKDLDAIERSHAAGKLTRTGNWTEGEIFTHLAAFINFGYDGYPKAISPPWLLSVLFIRPRKSKWLREGLPAGVRIPRTERGTVGMENVPFDEGLKRFRAALDRLEKTPPPIESPAFGPMAYQDKVGFALRHAELHLGFLQP
jgi:hypothetical protein